MPCFVFSRRVLRYDVPSRCYAWRKSTEHSASHGSENVNVRTEIQLLLKLFGTYWILCFKVKTGWFEIVNRSFIYKEKMAIYDILLS